MYIKSIIQGPAMHQFWLHYKAHFKGFRWNVGALLVSVHSWKLYNITIHITQRIKRPFLIIKHKTAHIYVYTEASFDHEGRSITKITFTFIYLLFFALWSIKLPVASKTSDLHPSHTHYITSTVLTYIKYHFWYRQSIFMTSLAVNACGAMALIFSRF